MSIAGRETGGRPHHPEGMASRRQEDQDLAKACSRLRLAGPKGPVAHDGGEGASPGTQMGAREASPYGRTRPGTTVSPGRGAMLGCQRARLERQGQRSRVRVSAPDPRG